MVALAVGNARLRIAGRPQQAGAQRAFDPLAAEDARPRDDFFRLRRPQAHDVDRPAQGVRPVDRRTVPLGDGQFRQAERVEPAHVHVAVVGHVDGNAVDEQRHLPGIEPAHVRRRLVAPADPRVDHARCHGGRLRHAPAPGPVGLFARHPRRRAVAARVFRPHHQYLAKRKGRRNRLLCPYRKTQRNAPRHRQELDDWNLNIEY